MGSSTGSKSKGGLVKEAREEQQWETGIWRRKHFPDGVVTWVRHCRGSTPRKTEARPQCWGAVGGSRAGDGRKVDREYSQLVRNFTLE